jgi:hypothetical protein
MKLSYHYEEVYKAPIYYIFNCGQKKAKDIFKEEIFGKNKKVEMLEKTWGVGHSFAYYKGDNTIYGIWIKDLKDVEVLAHELLHIVRFIFNDRGIYMDNNDEPFAYYFEYLIRKFRKEGKR